MAKRSERQKLVAAVGDLYSIGQRLYSCYVNDRSPNRAADMEMLHSQLGCIAQPIIDRYPPGYGHAPDPTPSEPTP